MDRALQQVLVVLFVVVLATSAISGVAAAQTTAGGTVVVEEGETVSEVNAFAGTIIVRGHVTGDVSGAAGNVLVAGTVDGNVDVATGSLRITGTVGGDVSAGAGSVHLADGGVVQGNVDAGAGDVRIDGTIGENARIGASTITLGESASIGGSLTYDGSLEGNVGAVEGDVTRDRSLGVEVGTNLQPIAEWAGMVYAFLINLLLGVVLLAVFPKFSSQMAERVTADPVRTGLIGLGAIVGVPVLLLAIAITVIGIPIALAGLLVFGFLAWIGLVYGRFALGTWLLSLLDREHRWVALLVGLFVAVLLARIPIVGGVLNFLIFLLGFGALFAGLYTQFRGGDSVTA